MVTDQSKHVFISYVREDSDKVDALCKALEVAHIPYWRDRKDLGPGDAWRAKIKAAIKEGSLVFLACFSENSRGRDKSYMNEELTLAVEEFRQMPPGRVWLIPVRFDEGDVPEWDLGAGRSLSDLNYADLLGDDRTVNTVELIATISNLLGEKQLDAASTLAAVEQASGAQRSDLIGRLTKQMLLDPVRRIELDDMVSQEVRRVCAFLLDDERLGTPLSGSVKEQHIQLVNEANNLWRLIEPFCASLHIAARWGDAGNLGPWANGLTSIVAAATRITSGNSAKLDVRHLPAVVSIYTAALTATGAAKWDNLKALVVDPTGRDPYDQTVGPLLELTSPYSPFADSDDPAPQMLAHAGVTGQTADELFDALTAGQLGKFYTPLADWLHRVLRPLFADQFHDDNTYDEAFDRAEVVLGVLSQDLASVKHAASGGSSNWKVRSRWFGRSTWHSLRARRNPVQDLTEELRLRQADWPPLRAGLFGSDTNRARAALANYQETFDEIARYRY